MREGGETISVGRFGNMSSSSNDYEFEGIWYNLESKLYHSENTEDERFHFQYSISTLISIDKFKEISEYTRRSNFGYKATENNCVHFAVIVWNMDKNSQQINSQILNRLAMPNELINELTSEENNFKEIKRDTMFLNENVCYYKDGELNFRAK